MGGLNSPLFKISKMKKTILFILILISLSVFSQKQGEITYAFKILENKEIIANEYIGKTYLETMNEAKNVKFKLIFTDSISVFKTISFLEKDNANSNLAVSMSGCEKDIYIYDGKTYRNNKASFFEENEYLIIDKINNNWMLHKDSKSINGYVCYKATSEYVVKNPKGEFRHPVIAWYCPEIPVSIGPKGYANLPGLILELQEWNIVFGVEKIEFKPSIEKIILSKKGKSITNENYQNKIAEIIQNQMD
jgi:GLPGLI family protein